MAAAEPKSAAIDVNVNGNGVELDLEANGANKSTAGVEVNINNINVNVGCCGGKGENSGDAKNDTDAEAGMDTKVFALFSALIISSYPQLSAGRVIIFSLMVC